jgi:hypothetical protein
MIWSQKSQAKQTWLCLLFYNNRPKLNSKLNLKRINLKVKAIKFRKVTPLNHLKLSRRTKKQKRKKNQGTKSHKRLINKMIELFLWQIAIKRSVIKISAHFFPK